MSIKRGINIIFLDIDGVLNSHTTAERCGQYIGIEDQKLNLLEIIVKHTKARIVLASTWKYFWRFKQEDKYRQDDLANYLDDVFAKHTLKVTAKTYEINPFKRGEGILDYLHLLKKNQVPINNFVIIDDMLFDYRQTKLIDHIIKTDSKVGLQAKHVVKAISLLKRKGDIVDES